MGSVMVSVGRSALEDHPETSRLLDAAREEFIAHGFRRTSVGAIADRARVSRRTVNRRLGEKDDIVIAVVDHELDNFFDRVVAPLAGLEIDEMIVELFTTGIRECRNNPLGLALRKFEPETMAAVMVRPDAMERPRAAIARALVAAGGVSMAEAEPVAELMARIAASLVISPSAVLPLRSDDQAREFARRWFVPLLTELQRGTPR
jgi:AcrR family transcriptional regulator